MHKGLGEDLIKFAKFSIDVYGLKIPENHPLTWDKIIRNYKRDNYIRRAGMIWLNFIISNFFEEDPDIVRGDSKEGDTSYARHVTMFFMSFHNHKRKDIAKFYNCTENNVGHSIRRIEEILNNKEKFHERKTLQILKYEIL